MFSITTIRKKSLFQLNTETLTKSVSYTDCYYHCRRKDIYDNSNSKLHHLLGPAVITEYYKEYFNMGETHRIDGPAYCEKNGTKKWEQHNKNHRFNGPVCVIHDNYGNLKSEIWQTSGIVGREDGPAIITYYENKNQMTVTGYNNGKRECVVCFDEYGTKEILGCMI